jgi:predicted outer membrane protein
MSVHVRFWISLTLFLCISQNGHASECLAMADAPARVIRTATPAQLTEQQVSITYVGHSTFVIESAGGVTIATDYAGYAGPGVVPRIVTMNHAHRTHYTDTPDPRIEALGKLAARNAAAEAVRTYGKTLAADHTRALDEASAVAAKLDLNPPDEPSAEAREEQTRLRKLSGRAFDQAFLNYMIKDHQTNIQNFEDQVRAGNGVTSKMAERQLPALRKHLEMAKTLKSGAKQ